MKTSKILFCWLGMTDIKASNGELESGVGPIAQAVKTFEFAEIHILSDAKKSANFAYFEWLKGFSDAEIFIHPQKLSSPMNFSEIYEAVVVTLKDVQAGTHVLQICTGEDAYTTEEDCTSRDTCTTKRGKKRIRNSLNHQITQSPNHQMVYHISPGTSAMAAIWIILAKSAYPAVLIQSSKEEGAKVISIPFEIAADFSPALVLGKDDELLRITQGLPPQAPEFDVIIHKCSLMKEMINKSRIVAMHDIPVLLNGESGTGKELFARAIHASSLRKTGPFIEVNCGAIPENLFESEFFGHEKDAFTGAGKEKKGYVESADGGTLFLDEIGELPLYAQVKLLRVIQEHKVMRVGATKPIPVDIRIISATNRNLVEEVALGNFREDLFHRLAIGVLNLPAIRERKGDLSILIDHFMSEINCEFRKIHGASWNARELSANAKNVLLRHSWPGNIRELRNTLSRLVLWASNVNIKAKEVSDAIFADSPQQKEKEDSLFKSSVLSTPGFNLQNFIGKVAVEYINKALEQTNGNKKKAAELLGFANYQTLNNWISKYSM